METFVMMFIPAVAMLAPAVITAMVLRYRRSRAEMRYQLLLKLAESGVELPTSLPGEATPQQSDLRRALVLLSGGIGLSVMLVALPLHYQVGHRVAELWGLGILPVALGLGYLSHWYLSRRGSWHG